MNQMTKYLKNEICEFRPLFPINYNDKKIIISTVLFKLYKGCYKSFDICIKGLRYLCESKYDYMTIRLFIDDTIFRDSNLMDKLRKLDVELVHFIPSYRFTIDGHLKRIIRYTYKIFPYVQLRE